MKIKRVAEAYAEIFRGIFWRHEFARRNEAVAKGSAELAKTLGIREPRFEIFIHDGYPLTDELFGVASKPEHETERKALGVFLETHKVLPVTMNSKTKASFFPKEYGRGENVLITYFADHLDDGHKIFNSLLLFEANAMSKLGLGHPVFFPLMPLVVDGIKLERLKLGCFNAPVLFDRSAPSWLLGKYSDALDFEMENSDREKATERKDQRIPWESFSEFTDILDHPVVPKPDEKKRSIKHEYYKTSIINGEKLVLGKDVDRGANWYDKKLKAARYWRDNYKEII